MLERIRWGGMARCGVLLVLVLGFSACASIPKNPDKPVSLSKPAVGQGLLKDGSEAVLSDKDGGSAFMLVAENADALRWRLALIDSARDSIDLQVFIWSNDEAGRLLLHRIIAASERGVRVRLLVDDMPKDWSDRATAIVSRLPNIQVRRFNPGRVRKGILSRTLQMTMQFRSLNRRMHNKQLIVDGLWAVTGGRNLGNPYFGLSKKYNNRDLDVLITGPVIRELAADFDEYWNAEATYPGEAMYGEIPEKKLKKILARFDEAVIADRALLDAARIPTARKDWSGWIASLPDRMGSGTAESLKDSPTIQGDRGVRLAQQLAESKAQPTDQSCIISPYMIPSKELLERLAHIVEHEGRKVRMLVPSMGSNNHTMAHSHYKKYRKRLLRAGAELYEFRAQPSSELRAKSDTAPVEADFISLHTKAFVLDDRWVVLGSLNLDPRSIKINTEHMLVIDSPKLAEKLQEQFDIMTASENAWHVTLNKKGKLRWQSGDEIRKRQPARGTMQRVSDFFYRWLPIEGQL